MVLCNQMKSRATKYSIIATFLLCHFAGFGQEEEKNWELSGYIKDMLTINFPVDTESSLVDNLIHNRLNFQWHPGPVFTTKVELRTRIFHGDLVRSIPNYSSFVDVNNDYLDLSYIPLDRDGVVAHTMIDRAYLQWTKEKWDLKVGRQRINWGFNLVWNPNDIFNAYSFFDFDYEERPGSDAIRLQLFKGFAGGYEFAIKMADSWEELTAATMIKWNKNNYDFQALGGVMQNNLVLGTGWAGNLGMAGFKGEVSYFKHLSETKDQWLASVSIDYSFPNALYLNGSILFNSAQQEGSLQETLGPSANLDVRSLSPFKYSTFLQASYQLIPLVNSGISLLYYPEEKSFFANPFVTLSLLQNLDGDIVGQFYFDKHTDGEFKAIYSALFVRLKYSF